MQKPVFIFVLLSIFFLSCKRENAGDCLKSTGAEKTEKRNVGSFGTVKLFDKMDLYIQQGPDYKVEITAGENLLSNIKSENRNGVLTLENKNTCNFVRGYKHNIIIRITCPNIQLVENRSVGTIRFEEGMVQDSVFVLAENSGDTYLTGTFKKIQSSSHGNGDMYLSGKCDKLFVYMFGTNSFKGENLDVSEYIFVENISIADCRLNAPESGTIECNIWRSGNVYYRGNPAIINNLSNGTGSGQIIKE